MLIRKTITEELGRHLGARVGTVEYYRRTGGNAGKKEYYGRTGEAIILTQPYNYSCNIQI